MTTNKRQTIFAVIIICSIGLFYLSTIRKGQGWGGDFSLYIHHAKNIATGQAYGNTGYIMNRHYTPLLSPQHYPPVFPVLLAPVYMAFGMNMEAMKVEVIFFSLLVLLVLFFLFKRRLSPPYTLMLLVLVGLNPYLWAAKDNILSDIPFLLFFFLSILVLEQTWNTQNKGKIYYSILAGLLVYLCYGTRAIGLIMIPSILLYELLQFKKITRVSLISTAVFVFFAEIQRLFLPGGGSYMKVLSFSPVMIISHIVMYSASMTAFWANGYSKALRVLFFAVLALLAGVGYVQRFRNHRSIMEVVILVYPAPLLIFPGVQGPRYLIPLFPLFIFYLFTGLNSVGFLQKNTRQKSVFGVLMVLALLSYAGRYTRMDFGPIREGVTKAESVALFDFIKKNTDKNAVFIFRKPRPLALFTDRKAAVYQKTTKKQEIWKFIEKIHADYIVTNRLFHGDQRFLIPLIQSHKDCLKQVYKNPDFRVFWVKRYADCEKTGGLHKGEQQKQAE